MGICQSSALKVTVYDPEGHKKSYNFTMKKMRTFQTIGDVLNLINIDLNVPDKIYIRSHVGLEEIHTHSKFEIRDLIVKNNQRVMKYRIMMEPMY